MTLPIKSQINHVGAVEGIDFAPRISTYNFVNFLPQCVEAADGKTSKQDAEFK